MFLLLNACSLWRLSFGKARQHVLSPYLLAAIIGFLVVGTFDSLIDVPRLALMFYILILKALMPNALNSGVQVGGVVH